jgi:signal peptidase I
MAFKFLTRKTLLRSALAICFVILAWIILAPTKFGGQVTYVIVNGNSMLPIFAKGDLVLLRQAPFYQVGDIVAYRYPTIGPVIHRIVARKIDRFVLQGDNNSWLDAYEPTEYEILGKYWLLIPGLGKIFAWLRTPWVMAMLVGTGSLLIGMTFMQTSNMSRKRRIQERLQTSIFRLGPLLANQQEGYLIVVYTVGILALILAVLSFTKPLQREVPDHTAYQQTGFYAYSAAVPAGIYDNNRIESGRAIFPGLTCLVDITFDYNIHTSLPFTGGGDYQLTAEVGSSSGWQREIALQPKQSFQGNQFHTQAVLDVCQVEQMIQQVQQMTGVQNYQYYLLLKPNVHISGQIGTKQLEETFSPPLKFVVEPQQIYLVRSEQEGINPLQPATAGLLTEMKKEVNQLSIFSLNIAVPAARWIAVIGLLLAAAGLAVPAYLVSRAERSDDKLLAQFVLGPRLVEVSTPALDPGEQTVTLNSLDDLVRLAERLGEVVFYHSDGQWVNFLVKDQATTYLYRKPAVPSASRFVNQALEAEIHRALDNNEFVLYYQPTVSLESGGITQIESFLRWRHPERGLLTPGDFLPQVEQAGLSPLIDNWSLRQGCAQLANWKEQGFSYPLAINISGQQLVTEDFIQKIQDVLQEYELPPDLIHLEIPEEAIEAHPQALVNLRQLKEMGIGVTISTSVEKSPQILNTEVGINRVKLGRALAQRMATIGGFNEIARQWIAVAHERKINVVAVGVETSEQLGFFRLNACDEAQGYFISPPLPAEDVLLYLRREGNLLDISLRDKS